MGEVSPLLKHGRVSMPSLVSYCFSNYFFHPLAFWQKWMLRSNIYSDSKPMIGQRYDCTSFFFFRQDLWQKWMLRRNINSDSEPNAERRKEESLINFFIRRVLAKMDAQK